MSIDAHFTIHRSEFELRVEIEVGDGEVLAVLGPNGSGKSTLLQALAGLQPIDEGKISLNGIVVDDADRGVFVMPELRHVGVMFQDCSLFNNLSIAENIAFGLRARGMRKPMARARAEEWLGRFSLESFGRRRPSSLSGGQIQRVALARALATEPAVLLLDEPTSALDVRAKAEIRRDLLRLRGERPMTTLLITHDPLDAFALADRVVVLEEGRVVQSGVLDDVASHPRSRHIADMVGLSLLHGEVTGGVLTSDSGARLIVPADTPPGRSVASIRPTSVSLHRTRPEGSARNSWSMTVTDLDRHPERVRVRLAGPVPLLAELTPAGADSLGLILGDTIWASVKASEVAVSPDLAP